MLAEDLVAVGLAALIRLAAIRGDAVDALDNRLGGEERLDEKPSGMVVWLVRLVVITA